jgi:hypothetical protein
MPHYKDPAVLTPWLTIDCSLNGLYIRAQHLVLVEFSVKTSAPYIGPGLQVQSWYCLATKDQIQGAV